MIDKNEGMHNNMNLATRAYELFKDDEVKARGMAEIIDSLESQYMLKRDAVTKEDLNNTELRLSLEIEKTRSEIEKTKSEIEKLRSETSSDIELLRSDTNTNIEKLKGELKKDIELIRSDMMKYMNRHTIWVITIMSIIIGSLKALDYILK